jgi:hypothetical protein
VNHGRPNRGRKERFYAKYENGRAIFSCREIIE